MNSLLSFRCESQKEINNEVRVQKKHSRSGNNSELGRMRAVLAVYTREISYIRDLSLSLAERGSAWVRSGKNCHVLCLNKSASVKFPLQLGNEYVYVNCSYSKSDNCYEGYSTAILKRGRKQNTQSYHKHARAIIFNMPDNIKREARRLSLYKDLGIEVRFQTGANKFLFSPFTVLLLSCQTCSPRDLASQPQHILFTFQFKTLQRQDTFWTTVVRFQVTMRDYPIHCVQIDAEAHLASYPVGTGGSFPGAKVVAA
jgi:hypothetical protein